MTSLKLPNYRRGQHGMGTFESWEVGHTVYKWLYVLACNSRAVESVLTKTPASFVEMSQINSIFVACGSIKSDLKSKDTGYLLGQQVCRWRGQQNMCIPLPTYLHSGLVSLNQGLSQTVTKLEGIFPPIYGSYLFLKPFDYGMPKNMYIIWGHKNDSCTEKKHFISGSNCFPTVHIILRLPHNK